MYVYILDAVKRSHSFKNDNFWINYRNNSQNNFDLHQHDKGYSRVYHGHEHKNDFDSIHPEIFYQDSRRHDFTKTLLTYKEQDHRKHNINPQCTRNMGSKVFDQYDVSECIPCKLKILKCTRKQTKKSQIVTPVCEDSKWQTPAHAYSNDFCKCNYFRTTSPNVNRCNKNTNCECVSIGCPLKPCPNMLRALGHTISSNVEKVNDFRNYDQFTKKTFNKHNHDLPIEDQGVNPNPVTYESFRKLDNHKIKLFSERKEYDPYHRQVN